MKRLVQHRLARLDSGCGGIESLHVADVTRFVGAAEDEQLTIVEIHQAMHHARIGELANLIPTVGFFRQSQETSIVQADAKSIGDHA